MRMSDYERVLLNVQTGQIGAGTTRVRHGATRPKRNPRKGRPPRTSPRGAKNAPQKAAATQEQEKPKRPIGRSAIPGGEKPKRTSRK